MMPDEDEETRNLSQDPKFWEMLDKAAAGRKTKGEDLPDPDDDAAWKRLQIYLDLEKLGT